ncbi:MAG TPA: ABC transporter permease [bacterium]|jgi:peptide/nickel transport system permease protein|nr:ABC transporter permease [bacterium]
MLLQNPGAVAGLVIIGALILSAAFANHVVPHDPFKPDPTIVLMPPRVGHWMGTDNLGRDMLSRIILGGRWSLSVGLIAVCISASVGLPLGLLAGYSGVLVDTLISRGIEVVMAIPGVLLAIAVIAVLGPGSWNVMLAVGIAGIPRYVRLIRSSVLSAREDAYVEAARGLGCSEPRVMFRHILPNIVAPTIVLGSIDVAAAILAASSLGFLGFGAQPPIPEWGALLSQARAFMRTAWWLTAFPGMAIMLTVLSMNLIGDGLRDALDPRLRREGF